MMKIGAVLFGFLVDLRQRRQRTLDRPGAIVGALNPLVVPIEAGAFEDPSNLLLVLSVVAN